LKETFDITSSIFSCSIAVCAFPEEFLYPAFIRRPEEIDDNRGKDQEGRDIMVFLLMTLREIIAPLITKSICSRFSMLILSGGMSTITLPRDG